MSNLVLNKKKDIINQLSAKCAGSVLSSNEMSSKVQLYSVIKSVHKSHVLHIFKVWTDR